MRFISVFKMHYLASAMRLMVMRGRKLSSTGAAQGIFERVQGSSIKDKMRAAVEIYMYLIICDTNYTQRTHLHVQEGALTMHKGMRHQRAALKSSVFQLHQIIYRGREGNSTRCGGLNVAFLA
jgi:hypothetical protein